MARLGQQELMVGPVGHQGAQQAEAVAAEAEHGRAVRRSAFRLGPAAAAGAIEGTGPGSG